jgi:riboflavin synthase
LNQRDHVAVTIDYSQVDGILTAEGQSIAVNGVCLTVVTIGTASFAADVSSETLRRTSLGSLGGGDAVNLERPLTPSSRFGGHIVQGHVDGTGQLAGSRADDRGAGFVVTIRFGPELGRYIVEKGSIAVDGISLTVASLGDDTLGLSIRPFARSRLIAAG